MKIRKTTTADLSAVMQIYAEAREFMHRSGNTTQWNDGHPAQELIARDIAAGVSNVCVDDNCSDVILAVFYFNIERDPTYTVIDGAWKNDDPYGVIHRIARRHGSDVERGVGEFCIKWCASQIDNIRIDTHRDNVPMRRLLDRLGFQYCGVIRIASGAERIAFQWTQI